MGYNTTVVIYNDSLHDIESDPEFGKRLVTAPLSPRCFSSFANGMAMATLLPPPLCFGGGDRMIPVRLGLSAMACA